jgi:hypothetical protein
MVKIDTTLLSTCKAPGPGETRGYQFAGRTTRPSGATPRTDEEGTHGGQMGPLSFDRPDVDLWPMVDIGTSAVSSSLETKPHEGAYPTDIPLSSFDSQLQMSSAVYLFR